MWLRFAFLASLVTPFLHVIALLASGQDAVATPVSELSRGRLGALHTLELLLFGLAHVALAVGLGGLERGRLWPYGRLLLVISGGVLFYIAWYFAAADPGVLQGESANDPLWLVATTTGLAMGALQPGLSRLARGLGLFCAICLGVWLWLMPLILLVNDSWLGAYERIVGTVYVTWMTGIALGLIRLETRQGKSQ